MGPLKPALAHLLHPRVLNRLTDSTSYGGEYSTRDMLRDLTQEIFHGSADTVHRRNLQIDYVDRLVRAQGTGSLHQVPASAVHDTLRGIERMHSGPDFWMSEDAETHRRYLRERIGQALEV
jgi:hypothetical protein